MSITMCMLVKDEINNIRKCLDPIINEVDEVLIMDNYSTDGTYELLVEHYGIKPLRGELSEERCFNKAELRNELYAQAKTDWIIGLDADESLKADSIKTFKSIKHNPNTSGYFALWHNHVNNEPVFEDYKLFIFKRGLQTRGLIHENVQIDIRQKGLQAQWLDGFVVEHYPDLLKHEPKVYLYKKRLECALKKQSDWIRYYWFLGYMLYTEGNFNSSIEFLEQAIASKNKLFPVEQLNSSMVLIEIYLKLNHIDKAFSTLEKSFILYNKYKDDFEVKINRRMFPWLQETKEKMKNNDFESIRIYKFAK